jgi:hypothetical protein
MPPGLIKLDGRTPIRGRLVLVIEVLVVVDGRSVGFHVVVVVYDFVVTVGSVLLV